MIDKEETKTYIGAGILKITRGDNCEYTTVSAMTPREGREWYKMLYDFSITKDIGVLDLSDCTCPPTPVLTIGNSLRELRKGKFLPQRAVAKVLGISVQQWNKYELDKNPISLKKLIILCDAFNIDIAEFIDHFTDIKPKTQTNAIEAKMIDLLNEKNKYIKELELKLSEVLKNRLWI